MQKYTRIKELREDNDKTQKDIIEEFGLHLTTYQRWESGEREIPAHMIKKLCKYYNISADYILELNDIPKSYKE